MTVGVIGFGMVGKAISRAFKDLGHSVYVYDKAIRIHKLEDVIRLSKVVFVCVPTPIGENGECNTQAVRDVLNKLNDGKYKGVVAIKSTVEPGTTQAFQNKFKELTICHVPEFLREKYGYEDFTTNHSNLVIGAESKEVADKVIAVHGDYPQNITIVSPIEAELIKYFSNTFKAYKTVFACTFGTMCDKLGADYSKVLEGYIKEGVTEEKYLKYNSVFKSFGGSCLPKDVSAMSSFSSKNNFNLELFDFLIKENSKF